MAQVDARQAGWHHTFDDADDHGNPIKIFSKPRQSTGQDSECMMSPYLLECIRLTHANIKVVNKDCWIFNPQTGRAYSRQGLVKALNRWCKQAGIPRGFTAHGLRKFGANTDVVEGFTTSDLMTKYGRGDIRMAEHYTKKVDRRKSAKSAYARTRDKSGT